MDFAGSAYICELKFLIYENFEVQYNIKLAATEIVRMDMLNCPISRKTLLLKTIRNTYSSNPFENKTTSNYISLKSDRFTVYFTLKCENINIFDKKYLSKNAILFVYKLSTN